MKSNNVNNNHNGLNMLKMEIYIIIYQKILKKLPGKIKLVHFRRVIYIYH